MGYKYNYGWGRLGERYLTNRLKSFKKISEKKLYELVKAEILYHKHLAEKHKCPVCSISAESVANKFQVKIHKVTQIFMKLNHEGLMSKRINNKNDWRWNPSRYNIYYEIGE